MLRPYWSRTELASTHTLQDNPNLKNHKHIALLCCLLLWASLLCSLNCVAAELVPKVIQSYPSDKSVEHLSGEVAGDPVGWLEQSVPPGAAASADHALPLLLLVYSLFFYSFKRLSLKPAKAKLGFASLAAQFRILPNAP